MSLSFDRRLWRDDIAGSRAHVDGLHAAELLDETEREAIQHALDLVETELAAGSFEFAPTDEDIHTAVERRTTELAGSAGRSCTRRAAATTRSPRTCACGASASSRGSAA